MFVLSLVLLHCVFTFQVWILFVTEGPFRSPTIKPTDAFNWTATYRRDSDMPVPHRRWVYYDERVKQKAKLGHNYAANKTKKVSYTVAVLLLIVRYRNILYSAVCNGAWHPRHKTVIFIFTQFQCLHLTNNILAIIRSTCKSVGMSHCACFHCSLN